MLIPPFEFLDDGQKLNVMLALSREWLAVSMASGMESEKHWNTWLVIMNYVRGCY